MTTFVYVRQSLDKTGAGAAVTRQREDCLRLCEERGWDIVRVWEENDTSASSRKPRPVYTAMLEAIERGDAQVLVAWHVDRLTRKLTDLEHLIEVTQRTGLRIVTVTGDIDLSNDAGRLVGRILASVARGEVERKGARQKRAQQQAAEQGRPAGGRRAFGYGSDGETIIDDEAALVRDAYSDLLAGASLKGIARKWNELGVTTTAGNPWRHDNVRSMLKNPRYAGLRAYKGQVVGPATWKALVDEETHEAAVALLSLPERRTTQSTARKHLLPAIAHCWKCGSDVATGHSRHGKRLYICRASKCISRKADPVDELVEAVVVARLSRPDAVELLSEPSTPDLESDRATAEAIKERINDLAIGLEEGLLTLGAVRKSSDRLRVELDKVEARMRNAVEADVLTPLVTADDVAQTWAACDLQQKRAVISALMTITLHPPERGHQPFDPDSVRIEWRAEA
ncbi:recombinase family protein [Nocardioides sp. cx-173]|uniref:recombinase family protein n=1 Tax=Nocardioides sp. cx-173 TaxID=2898796 RepID=UPI001E2E89C2|nr:recombinase family protein [Nocardioides sp. cx-173]MCD4525228.1 recombinase family protein [Nocardioides sp. cx-173]UGB40969.1 recombinase family protein [Nocardioides sp. cx-173]